MSETTSVLPTAETAFAYLCSKGRSISASGAIFFVTSILALGWVAEQWEGLDLADMPANQFETDVNGSEPQGRVEKEVDWPLVLPHKLVSQRITGPPPGGYSARSQEAVVPFPWFCHPTGENITMEGPGGVPVEVARFGMLHMSQGEHIFHYAVNASGTHIIRSGEEVIANFTVHPEECYCPEDMEDFKRRYQCHPDTDRHLDKLFSRWIPQSVTLPVFEDTTQFGEWVKDFVRVSIVNNTAHYRRVGGHLEGGPDAEHFYIKSFKKFLQSILRKVKIPDCEFYHSYAVDWATVDYRAAAPPIIAQGHSDYTAEIPGPTSHEISWIFDGHPLMFASFGTPWHLRHPVAFFRGSNSGSYSKEIARLLYNPRFRLAFTARDHPAMDAKVVLPITTRWQTPVSNQTYEWAAREKLAVREGAPEDVIKEYKYVLNPDGNAASWRMHYQMASGALIIKQKSPMKEWWYDHLLEDGVNFLETGQFFDDLQSIVEWALTHDSLAEKIARNAFHAWAQRARSEDAYCWMAGILARIGGTLKFKPSVHRSMAHLEDEMPHKRDCTCQYGSPD